MKVEPCTPEALRRVGANHPEPTTKGEEFLYLVDDKWIITIYASVVFLSPVSRTEKWVARYTRNGLRVDEYYNRPPDEVIDLMRATYELLLT